MVNSAPPNVSVSADVLVVVEDVWATPPPRRLGGGRGNVDREARADAGLRLAVGGDEFDVGAVGQAGQAEQVGDLGRVGLQRGGQRAGVHHEIVARVQRDADRSGSCCRRRRRRCGQFVLHGLQRRVAEQGGGLMAAAVAPAAGGVKTFWPEM